MFCDTSQHLRADFFFIVEGKIQDDLRVRAWREPELWRELLR